MIVTIDDRSLLFALDRLYRKAMQGFERETLLVAARRVAKVLRLDVSNLAPEGYYATDRALAEYFRLMRALQAVPESREREVAGMPEFQRLWDVANSRIYGHPDRADQLLPQGIDALGRALLSLAPEWTVARIVPAARAAAIETDDYSLVGLAARVEDAVVLTALRESVVLYARTVSLGPPPRLTFEWKVDPDLAKQANRFVQAFNALVPDAVPSVIPANARLFHEPDWDVTLVAGRCVRLGVGPLSRPVRHYHWAICARDSELEVREFWADELWTTARYLTQRTRGGQCDDS
jgi:hypothetical protein